MFIVECFYTRLMRPNEVETGCVETGPCHITLKALLGVKPVVQTVKLLIV